MGIMRVGVGGELGGGGCPKSAVGWGPDLLKLKGLQCAMGLSCMHVQEERWGTGGVPILVYDVGLS